MLGNIRRFSFCLILCPDMRAQCIWVGQGRSPSALAALRALPKILDF